MLGQAMWDRGPKGQKSKARKGMVTEGVLALHPVNSRTKTLKSTQIEHSSHAKRHSQRSGSRQAAGGWQF